MNVLRFVNLKAMKLWQKFLLLGMIATPAALVPAYYSYTQFHATVTFLETEQRGVAPLRDMLETMHFVQQLRNLSASQLAGDNTMAAARATTIADINRQVGELEAQLQSVDDKGIIEAFGKLKRETAEIIQAVNNKTMDVTASNAEHTRIVHGYLTLSDKLLDHYQLSLDPDAYTYFLIQSVLVHLPNFGEPFHELRSLGTAMLREGKQVNTHAQDAQLAGLIRESHINYEKFDRDMNKMFRHAPKFATGKFNDSWKLLETRTERGISVSGKEIRDAGGDYTMDAETYRSLMTEAVDLQLEFSHLALETLTAELNDKASSAHQQEYTKMAIMLVLIALALGVGFAIIRSVIRPVAQLQGVMEGLRQGDTTLRARLDGTDEIGNLGRQFDTMVDEREAVAAKIKKENDALNDSIIEILRSVSKLSQGDLRVQAPVREDVTGALSDAINAMTESTVKTLAGVTISSEAVRAGSQIGRETALATAQGMNDVRGTIQETGKRIKRLGERSQEIGGIVKLIDDIAERTSVLALNANMQAAVAGEAGRGFRVVADEVQRLAERSKEATDQISKLVSTIQGETNDTMAIMERAIGEVVKGGELAEKAATQVSNLEKLGNDLSVAVQAFTLPETAQATVIPVRRAA